MSEFNDGGPGLDLDALSTIETEKVVFGDQTITVTMLVPADIEKCRKLVRKGLLNEDVVMEYMTFQSIQKAHPEITWHRFQKLNFRVVNKLMAVMAILNGFDETFQIFGRTGNIGSTVIDEKVDSDELDL